MKLRLYDNTRLSDYKRCPRLFFYRHIMHWKPQSSRVPLIFGGAWHSVMEVIWEGLKNTPRDELVKAAYSAFLGTWCEEGLPYPLDFSTTEELAPRTPGQALEMIVGYIDYRAPQANDFDVLSIEKPFIVPLDPKDPTLYYVGKIDKIVRYRGKILGIEHKTTTAYKKNGPFKSAFLDSFSPNSQVDGYLYALHMMFPGEVGGVWVDAALVHKSEEGFTFIPIEKTLRHLDSWIWETRDWIRQVEVQKAELALTTETDPYMSAFPKNTNSCWDFNSSCAYMYLCKSWTNPLGKPVPSGFEVEQWDPLNVVRGLDELVKEVA